MQQNSIILQSEANKFTFMVKFRQN